MASATSPHTPSNKHQQQECHVAQRETGGAAAVGQTSSKSAGTPQMRVSILQKGDVMSCYDRTDVNAPLSNFLSLTRRVESFPSGTMSTSVNTKVSLNMTPAMVTSGKEAAGACGRRRREAPIATVDGRRGRPPPGPRRAHRSDRGVARAHHRAPWRGCRALIHNQLKKHLLARMGIELQVQGAQIKFQVWQPVSNLSLRDD